MWRFLHLGLNLLQQISIQQVHGKKDAYACAGRIGRTDTHLVVLRRRQMPHFLVRVINGSVVRGPV